MHVLVHPHLNMHQHTHQHAFTPNVHRSLTILPAAVGIQDSKLITHPPRGTEKPSFAPVTAFHRAAQKTFRSTKRGRWGALHVCIAWKIHYHEQLKKVQQKPKSLHQELTAESSASSPPDSVQHKESDQPSCMHPNQDSPHSENVRQFNRSYPSDLHTSAPTSCCSRATTREKLEHPAGLNWTKSLDEEEKQQTDTPKDLPRRDKSWDQTPELDGRRSGSLDRKRQLECDSFVNVKRVKQEVVDDRFDSSDSKTFHTDPSLFRAHHTHPSSYAVPVQHINTSDLSVFYPNSSRCDVSRAPGGLISYPGAEMHPYQTASWVPMWGVDGADLPSRPNHRIDFSLNTCRSMRIPLAAQRGFFTPPLHLPLALRQQEAVYLRGREFLHSRHENRHLQRCGHQVPHPGFLAASYLGP